MAGDKQSSNQSTVFKARETSLMTIDATAAFETREPNSFSDFGGEPTQVARRPFSQSRQRKKGSNVDLDVTAGWNEDFTFNNMQSVLDSFCYAALRTKPKTEASAATAADDTYAVDDEAGFVANSIVLVKGFSTTANNGIHIVASNAAGEVVVGNGLVDESGATATLEVVGHRFANADMAATLVGGKLRLTSAAMDMTTFGVLPGEWHLIGGQEVANSFSPTNRGYARLSAITADYWEYDKVTFAALADAGADTALDIYFGTVVRNEEDPDLIVKLTDTIERPLGRDDDGRMSEVVTGATANELTWNSPLAALVNVDVTYIGMQHVKRPGTDGVLAGSGTTTLATALGEDGWNTSRNLYRCRIGVLDGTLNPTPLFGKVTEWTLTIANNVSPDKAQGIYGAFDTTEGMFEVDGEFTAYFKDMRAGQAIDDDADVTFDAIYTKQNKAFIMDVPLISLGGGRPNVEQDTAIMLPLTTAAAESPFGHTLLLTWLSYVPNYAVSTGAIF
ncbi:putative tail protein [Sphingomonas phage Eidolon]|uniref:Putative tail protein n=1 Tax=Sphingomonas phage Eidolon TaxID=2686311 RepID=A0A6M3T7X7_9CAUD|nr:putative tail protein [Sphingomonas phage Eidolon]QJD54397.1 putative tail protein [Sphingomonas phage Eidolon]